MKTIETILIDPENKSVKEITIEGFDKETFRWLHPIIGCNLVELVHLDRKTVMVIDEEGLLKPNYFFHFDGLPHLKGVAYAGKAIIMMDTADGYLRGLTEKETPFAFLAVAKSVVFDGDDIAADRAMDAGVLKRPQSAISGMDDNFNPVGEPQVTWKWSPNISPPRTH